MRFGEMPGECRPVGIRFKKGNNATQSLNALINSDQLCVLLKNTLQKTVEIMTNVCFFDPSHELIE